MAVTVVTTEGSASATAYVSVADFTAWCTQHLKDITGKTSDQLGKAVNDGAEYMDVRHRFIGYRLGATQAREWPRQSAWDVRNDKVEGIPQEVKDANCGYAFRALSAELMPDPTRDATGRVIKSKDEKVGPISESTEYETISGYDLPIFPAVDRLLYRRGLVCRQGGISSGDLVRA